MRKLHPLVFALIFLPFLVFAQQQPIAPSLDAKSWLLIESGSGQVLAAEAPDQQLEPASLTKLMTAYLTFAALKQGTLKLDQPVTVSERAWKTGGSRMFIKLGTQVSVDDLIKGMIVQSGNDACVALSEAVAGSEDVFAQMMNREAQRLGLKASSFRNSTGWPDPQHYTTARDLATLAGALIRDFPEYYAKYYSLKEYTYNKITQPNRNRLLFIDPSVDGVKTGHTDAAGYCLIASAKRGPRRLLSVVLGTSADKVRAQESLKLLNFGFQFYDAVPLFAKGEAVANVKIWKGKESTIKVGFVNELMVAVPKGFADKLKSEFVPPVRLMAPVPQGQMLGMLKLTLDGKPFGEFPVLALEGVEEAGFFGRLIDTIRLWFN